MSNIIFVYGTLKREHGNYTRFIESDSNSVFLGEAVSVDANYAMLGFGAPVLFKDQPNGHSVKGELFEVSDEALARIDRLEGNPHCYRREQRPFTTVTNGAVLTAWVYLSAYPLPIALADRPAPINKQNYLVWPWPVEDEDDSAESSVVEEDDEEDDDYWYDYGYADHKEEEE